MKHIFGFCILRFDQQGTGHDKEGYDVLLTALAKERLGWLCSAVRSDAGIPLIPPSMGAGV